MTISQTISNRSLDPEIPTWLSTLPTNHRPGNFWIFFFHEKKLWKVMQSISVWTDIENRYRLSRASCIYVQIQPFKKFSQCISKFSVLAICQRLQYIDDSTHFRSVGDRKRMWNNVMFIYRHDMSSGLRWYASIWTSFRIFLPQSNNFRDGFDCQ